MEYVEWCNLCQQQPADGILEGYFAASPDELMTLNACNKCAAKAFEEPDIAGIR